MHRIDSLGALASPPTPRAAGMLFGHFNNAPPGPGVQPTISDADWCEMVQEELASILAAAGVTPVKGSYGQVLASLQMLFASLAIWKVLTVGTSRTLTAAASCTEYIASAAVTLTLPTAAAVPNGTTYIINARGGAVTVTPDGAAGIQGGAAGLSFVFPVGTSGMLARDDTANWSLSFFVTSGSLGSYLTGNLMMQIGVTYFIDSSAGGFTLTLPPAPAQGAAIHIIDVGHALRANPVTLARNGGTGTIGGVAQDCVLNLSGLDLIVSANGTDWRIQ